MGADNRSEIARTPAADITGTAIKNENLAEDSRLKPRSMPPEIVDPEREMPGNKAKTWKKPIQRESSQLTVSRDLTREPKISAISKKMLVKRRKIDAAFGLLKDFSSRS